VAGGRVTYALTITNAGPLPATGVVVNDALPPGVTLLSASSDGGRGCAFGRGGAVSCFLGELDPGDVGKVLIEVLVDAAASGTMVNTAAVLANEVDPDLSNNAMTLEAPIQVQVDLTIRE